MSKSILVIDTPKHCMDCVCYCYDGVYGYCRKEKRIVEIPNEGFRPSWCQLKRLDTSIASVLRDM